VVQVVDEPVAESLVVVYLMGVVALTKSTWSPLLKLLAYVDELYPDGNPPYSVEPEVVLMHPPVLVMG
jgi:hypothetical protein